VSILQSKISGAAHIDGLQPEEMARSMLLIFYSHNSHLKDMIYSPEEQGEIFYLSIPTPLL
jgi:hypothetical protein